MGRGSSGISGNSNQKFINAIKDAYPKSVIGEFKDDGTVSFRYTPNGKEYTYRAINEEELANKLRVKTGTGLEGNGFFGNTKMVSNDYFKMERQVQGDTVAVATNNIVVRNGSPVLITGPNEGIYLKDNQFAGIAIKDGRTGQHVTDSIMVKMNKTEFNNAKRYKVNSGDISVDKLSFDDLKDTAKAQEKGSNLYKSYRVAIYNNRIETSVGRKGRKIV